MKTVTGKITNSTPITIAKAASILSKFVSTETGASQAVNAYLRRATAAFDELARLHSKSDRRKHKKESAPTHILEASQGEFVNNSDERRVVNNVKEEGNLGEETERKKKNKKEAEANVVKETDRENQTKKEKFEVKGNDGEVLDETEIKEEEEKKKKKKKKKTSEEVKEEQEEEENDGEGGLEEEGKRKKKRRKQVDDI